MTKFTICLHQKEETAIQLPAVNIYKRRFNKQTSIFATHQGPSWVLCRNLQKGRHVLSQETPNRMKKTEPCICFNCEVKTTFAL